MYLKNHSVHECSSLQALWKMSFLNVYLYCLASPIVVRSLLSRCFEISFRREAYNHYSLRSKI